MEKLFEAKLLLISAWKDADYETKTESIGRTTYTIV